jgi:integrase/recombinase XerD
MLGAGIEEYVATREALGFKFDGSAAILRDFERFALKEGDSHVRWTTAVRWAKQAKSADGRRRRLGHIRRLAAFLRADDPTHELIPVRLFAARTCRPMPYIFTESEVATIMAFASLVGGAGSFRALTFSTYFGLLAATGLRAREALRLRMRDVREDGLVIENTKFRKSRFLPVHPTTAEALKRYREARERLTSRSDSFFLAQRSRRAPTYATVWWTFRQICIRAGIGDRSPSGRPPRIHDLRHTFAVRSLEKCPTGRQATERHAAALATYLGHANPRHTFHYLHSSPQLLRDVARACERGEEGGAR